MPDSNIPATVQPNQDMTVRSQGEHFTAPLAQGAQFSEKTTSHHKPFYDDYTVAKMHILQAVGDLSELDLFGNQVLCAVFCRPNRTAKGVYLPVKEIKNDWWEHKVVLILKIGPDAFTGEDSYFRSTFGDRPPPQPGEWLFSNANAGIQINLAGDGCSRPQGVDHRGEPMDIFEWDGWPCRIMGCENFIGRLCQPHFVI